jgi:acyl carrier protein
MQRTEVIAQLQTYFAQDVLDGRDIDLDETTPLLEWGIINSLEIVRLLSFIHTSFAMDIPMHRLTADHFATLSAIADLVIGDEVSV